MNYRILYIICVLLFINLNAFSQDELSFLDRKGNLVKFNSPEAQLKYVLNNEFGKLITGNSISGLGNYAAVSTSDNTLSAGFNIVREKDTYR